MSAALPAIPHEGTWRPDIDGLRALAVLAVIGYHYFPAVLQGGFVGVDIFFVISGYLITGILADRLGEGRFSIATFYLRRIRRIFPALAVVLASALAFGFFWLYPGEFEDLGAHTAASAGFLSNFLLWRESGYFDLSIDTKALAHLWSLGVEEQFYLLWPLLLWAVWGRAAMPQVLVLLVLLSFTAGAWMLQRDPTAAFYLPLFRFWELMAGGLLAIATRRSGMPDRLQARRDGISALGMLLVVAGLFLVHSGLAFPGPWALLPVGGTVLVIAAGPRALCNRTLLSWRPLVWIGLVSFPLYLWHWPLLVMARTVFNAEPAPQGMLVLFGASMVLAFLTYRLVEVPVRTSTHLRRDAGVVAGILCVVGLAGWAIAQGQGFPQRPELPEPPRLARNVGMQNAFAVDGCGPIDPAALSVIAHCISDRRGPVRYALLGDSKAAALFTGVVNTSSERGRWLFIGGSLQHAQMVPLLSDLPQYRRYQEPASVALDAVARNAGIETVVLVAATRALFRLQRDDTIADLPASPNEAPAREGLQRFVGRLLAAGKRVVLVVDNPTLPRPARCLSRARWHPPQPLARWFAAEAPPPACTLSLDHHLKLSGNYRRLLAQVRQMDPARISVFDTIPLLCDGNVCPVVEGDHLLYGFTDHISDHASHKVGAALNAFLHGQQDTDAPRP